MPEWLFDFLSGPTIKIAAAIWNSSMKLIIKLVCSTPQKFSTGTWAFVKENLYPWAEGIGLSALNLLFMIAFLKAVSNLHQNITLEMVIEAMIKVVVANVLYLNILNIMTTIFSISSAMAKEVFTIDAPDLKVEDMEFDSIIPAVTSGKADFGAAGMTVDETRKKSVDFTDTYANASQVIIVKEDSEITGSADLADKKIGVQLGTTGDLLSSELAGDENVERYNKGFEAVQALLQGKIDAVVIDSAPAKVFVEQSEGLKVCEEAMSQEEYAIAVKKGNTEMLDKINGALKELKEDGTIDEIINKYIPAE